MKHTDFDHLAWGSGSWSLCLSCICLLSMHTLICVTFSLPPGVRGWLRLLRVALPGLFCLPFSNLIDILLQPYSKYVKSYIKDATYFLSKLSASTSPETIIATFDVENLYTNITHDLGLEAVQYMLFKYFSLFLSLEYLLT